MKKYVYDTLRCCSLALDSDIELRHLQYRSRKARVVRVSIKKKKIYVCNTNEILLYYVARLQSNSVHLLFQDHCY